MTKQAAIIVGAVALVVAFGASYAIGSATGGSDKSAAGEARTVPRSGDSPQVSKLSSSGALPALREGSTQAGSGGGQASEPPPDTGSGSAPPSSPAPSSPAPAPAPQPKPKPKGNDGGGKKIF